MSNGIVDEIRRQIERGSMQDKEAIGFIAELQLQIFDQLDDLKKGQKNQDDEISKVKKTVEDLDEQFQRYPSLIWLAYNRPWIFIIIIAIFIFVVSIVIDPMNVVDFGLYLGRALGW